MTYAVDAAVAVALANTLFFAAATAESKTNVALYLVITVAPFAVVAPVIGPLLDRLQRGRRAALAVSFAGRALLAVVMAFSYDIWLLYPAALGVLVLSKSFSVLKAAVTPRVLPPAITLVTTNSRLTTFGLVAGGVFGAGAAGRGRAVGLAGRADLHGGARRRRHRALPAHPALGGVHGRRGARGAAQHHAGQAPPDGPRAPPSRCGATGRSASSPGSSRCSSRSWSRRTDGDRPWPPAPPDRHRRRRGRARARSPATRSAPGSGSAGRTP